MKFIKGIICSKLSDCYDNFFQLHVFRFFNFFNTRVSTSMFIFSLKIKPQTKMRGLRKRLTLSTVNQVESKNIIQILLFYLFSTASMELLCFFLFLTIDIFNHLCCSLDTGIQKIYFFQEPNCSVKSKTLKELLEGLCISVQCLQKWEGSLLKLT